MEYGKKQDNNYPVLHDGANFQQNQIPQNYQGQPQTDFSAQQYPMQHQQMPPNNIPYGQPMNNYPPPQYGSPMQDPGIINMGSTHVAIISDIPISQKRLPADFQCPVCSYQGRTQTEKQVGNAVWIWVLIICFFAPILACIPCLMDDCKDVKHNCPSCKSHIDTYHKNAC